MSSDSVPRMSDKAELIAAAQVNAFAGPPAGIEFKANVGFKTATRNSAGAYELELDDKHDGHKLVINVSRKNGGPGSIEADVVPGDTKKIEVTSFDSSDTAADTAFFITVYRVSS
jgi:hypothetical protein